MAGVFHLDSAQCWFLTTDRCPVPVLLFWGGGVGVFEELCFLLISKFLAC